MKRLILLALAIPSAVFAAEGPPAAGVSFSKDIAPVFRTRCAACHMTGKEPGKLALHPKAARASLVDRQSLDTPLMLVAPGKPDESYLLAKLEGTHVKKGGKGVKMPLGQAPLNAEIMGKIRSWIAAGAPDN